MDCNVVEAKGIPDLGIFQRERMAFLKPTPYIASKDEMEWQSNHEEIIGAAEGILNHIYQQFGHTFTFHNPKKGSQAQCI